MIWVMDCSVAAALALPDERSPIAVRFVAGAREGGEEIRVPALWWYEVTHTLVSAVRSRSLEAARVDDALDALRQLGAKQDGGDLAQAMRRSHVLAAEHGLTAFDAAYLELSLRLGAGLATLDRNLAKAARTAGVAVFT